MSQRRKKKRRVQIERGEQAGGAAPCTDCASGPTTVMRPVLPSMLIDDTPVSCPRPHRPHMSGERGAGKDVHVGHTHLLDLLDTGAFLPDGDADEVRVDGEVHDHAAGHLPLHGKEVRLHTLVAVVVAAVAVVGVGRGSWVVGRRGSVQAWGGSRVCVLDCPSHLEARLRGLDLQVLLEVDLHQLPGAHETEMSHCQGPHTLCSHYPPCARAARTRWRARRS